METNDSIRYLNNIKTSFQKMKAVTVAAVVACVAVCLGSLFMAYRYAEKSKDNIYVLDDGSVLRAIKRNNLAQRDLEAKDHLTRFHELFFNVAPNTETINKNTAKALALADRSAYDYFNDLKEKQFYMRLIQNNASQQVTVDSVKVDMRSVPYRAAVYLTRYYVRQTSVTKYQMTTTCNLAEAPRSETNPHGLTIERFMVASDVEVGTRNR